ncbi:MAG: methyltransferase domain-containing protein [Hyphomonadaceae bacterium]|nr:methyltransferase domain-containing protein [Hyphomonadaceae bacterium]
MVPPTPFDARLLRARKRRAAGGFHDATFLHKRSAKDLAERLEAIPRPFPRALALGGGALFREALAASPLLAARIGELTEADIAGAPMEIDPEHLPFADTSFDLIVSPLLLHWVNDLPGAFIQLQRALKPDGLLLAALFGGETLHELRFSLLEAESELRGGAALRVAPFADLQDIAGLLQRAGFALPAADRDLVTVRYREPLRLLADLRAMGETAALSERAPPLRRDVLMRAMEIYAQRYADADGRVRATFEIITATGWAPHESQQKPLKPGSAKTRLADALKTTEQSAGEKAGE